MTSCKHWQERLADRAGGALDDSEIADVDAHIASCPSCRRTAREYETMLATYRDVADERPNAETDRRILEMAATATTDTNAATATDAATDTITSTDSGVASACRRVADQPRTARRPGRHGLAAITLAACAAVVVVTWTVVRLLGSGGGPGDTSRDYATLVAQGDRLAAQGRVEPAIVALERAFDVLQDTPDPAVLHKLAALYESAGRFEEAVHILERLAQRYPAYAKRRAAILEWAQALEQLQEPRQAVGAYDLLAREFPEMRDHAVERIEALADHENLRKLGYLDKLSELGYIR